jgi:glycosyltransferase involved in cell wall biosynthesis/3-hydroxyisobutyrate dehydrogenase-like beta-hydroxyacid dehydrogenase
MFHNQEKLPSGGRPLRVMFVHTSLFVGGAETLLVDLIRRLDRGRIVPEVCCLKDIGPLGKSLADDVPIFHHLIKHKYDAAVMWRLARLFRRRGIDAIVTVGAGDKMFWGRLAARLAGVPVVASALHSTGWPDGLGRANRLLTPITDAFIAVAEPHGRYLIDIEHLPAECVHVVVNGVDTDRFYPHPAEPRLRTELGLAADAPVAGIVARLGSEKNHEMFLEVARRVRERVPAAQFLIVGDGVERERLERLAAELNVADGVHFLGNRADVPELLALIDVFLLTSHIEASPVSILEALATGKPVVATRVGSVGESVPDGRVGYLVEPGDAAQMAEHVVELLQRPELARSLGAAGRRLVVERWSVDRMVEGYQSLLEELYSKKAASHRSHHAPRDDSPADAGASRVPGYESRNPRPAAPRAFSQSISERTDPMTDQRNPQPAQQAASTTIGILYPGEMGSALGGLFAAAGFHVVTTVDGRSERTRDLARGAALQMRATLAEVVDESDVLLSLVPPEAAIGVAREAGSRGPGKPGAIYVDLNSVSPETALSIAEIVGRRGWRFVDAAVHGQATRLPQHGRMYLSGASAVELADLWRGLLDVHVLGGEPGRASALKMLMSGVSKGLVALFVEMALTAEAAGLLDEFLENCGSFYPGVSDPVARMLPTYPRHAARRAQEMREVAAMAGERGLRAGIVAEAGRLIANLSESDLASRVSEQASVRDLIQAIAGAGVGIRGSGVREDEEQANWADEQLESASSQRPSDSKNAPLIFSSLTPDP